MLDRMIKDDLKKMGAIGDHVLSALDMYEVHDRISRWYIKTGQKFLERALKRIEKL